MGAVGEVVGAWITAALFLGTVWGVLGFRAKSRRGGRR